MFLLKHVVSTFQIHNCGAVLFRKANYLLNVVIKKDRKKTAIMLKNHYFEDRF